MMTTLWHGTWPLLPTWVSNVIKKSVGEEGHNHQEKYFQFYENKRWLTAQTVPLCVELPKDFHFLLNSKPKRWQCQYCKESFSIELNILSVSCQIQKKQYGFGRTWVSVGKLGHSFRRKESADPFTSGRVQVSSKKWMYYRYKQIVFWDTL